MRKVQRQRVRKHRRDQNHGKCGFVGGNRRYDRRHPEIAKGMGRASVRGF